MADTDIGSAVASNLKGIMTDYSVATVAFEGVGEQKETTWTNSKFTQWLGYYKNIPEIKAAINAKTNYTLGKGFTADPVTELILGAIKGNGKDTFNTILENLIRTYQIGGDAYAEIITNEDGILINLKPLDPAVMVHVFNHKGMLIRFEQNSKIPGNKPKKFKPEDIFYLARNRIGDEMHGVSDIEAVEWLILARNEAMDDFKTTLHRFVVPRWIIHLDTDDTSEVKAFKAKMDDANKKGENMYIPKGTVELEQMTISPNSTLNPLTWIENLSNYFYEAFAVPRIVVGGAGGFTEAAVKVAHLSFQQTIEPEQLYVMDQVLSQLNHVIKLAFPVSLQNEALSERPKVEEPIVENRGIETETPIQPNDITTEMEGNR